MNRDDIRRVFSTLAILAKNDRKNTRHKSLLAAALLFGASITAAQENTHLVLPTERQAQWSEAEFGVLLHYDLPCFEGYDQKHPEAKIFRPDRLNTDQWVKTVRDMGAKYIVMIAKHGTGFCLWPSKAHECTVQYSPWKNGRGDVIREFVKSCHKYDIKYGFYYCTHCNDYCGIDHHKVVGKMTQEEYNRMMTTQLSELWSNYGELFEVWFDGGLKPVSEGGLDLKPLLEKLQPNAIAFQGPTGFPNLIRWVGNEAGVAPDPSWSTTDATTGADGMDPVDGLNGLENGQIWCPGESDCTLRHNYANGSGWMFKYDHPECNEMFTVEELMDKYETTIGRNTNMLIGLVIDNHGLIPSADVQRALEFGQEIQRRWGSPLCQATDLEGCHLTLLFPSAAKVDRCILQEDIRQGERVRRYLLEGQAPNGQWTQLREGSNIGHKRIIRFPAQELTALRLIVAESVAEPRLKNFAVFGTLESDSFGK